MDITSKKNSTLYSNTASKITETTQCYRINHRSFITLWINTVLDSNSGIFYSFVLCEIVRNNTVYYYNIHYFICNTQIKFSLSQTRMWWHFLWIKVKKKFPPHPIDRLHKVYCCLGPDFWFPWHRMTVFTVTIQTIVPALPCERVLRTHQFASKTRVPTSC